jgi:NodT family efflux transporter outer membrane factor (OMF) lipoprotein
MNWSSAIGRRVAVGVLVSTLAGCAVGPDFSSPARPAVQLYTPVAITDLGSAGPLDREQHVTLGVTPHADWWKSMGSADIDRLVALALANNQTLEEARANLAMAAETVSAMNGGRYPQIDAVGSVGRRRYGASFLGPQGRDYPIFSAFSLGADISYDFDIFGGIKRSVEQASAAAEYEQEQLQAAKLSVSGSTVLQALQIASVRAQMRVIEDVLESDEKTLALVRAARAAGVVSDMDVLTATSQRDSDRTLLPPLRQELNVAQDALAVLVGRSPASWSAPEFSLDVLHLPLDLSLSLPSELVHARPDIRAAEAQLHRASAAVGVATADMYPRIALSAGMAEEGILHGGTAPAWSFIGGLTAPLFHGGTLSAKRRGAEDAYRAALAGYQQTVLTSFGQVADVLHSLENDAGAMETQEQALATADAALRLVRQGYGVGNAGIVEVLTTQRLRQLAELGLVQARAQRFADTVRLSLAAGDGLT